MKHLFRIIILLTFFFIFNVKASDASDVWIYKFKLSDITCSFTFNYVEGDSPEFKCYDASGSALSYENGSFYSFKCNGIDYTLTYDSSAFFSDGLAEKMYNSGCSAIGYKFENAYMVMPDNKIVSKQISIGDYKDNVLENGDTAVLIPYSNSTSSDSSNSSNSYNRYDDIEMCNENSNDYIYACACMPAAVADITSFIYGFLKIGGPVLLIILGAIDLGKAIVATDESGIQKAKKKLINKFVAAACIFLAFSVIQMIVNIVGGGDYVQQVEGNCLYYLLNGFKP